MNILPLARNGEISPGDGCPFHSSCNADRCPSTKKDLNEYQRFHPLPTIEQTCALAILKSDRAKTRQSLIREVRAADLLLDEALILSIHDEELASGRYKKLSETFGNIAELDPEHIDEITKSSKYPYHSQIRVMEAFMPAYRDRVHNRPVRPHSALHAHMGVCEHIRDFNHLYPEREIYQDEDYHSLVAEYSVLSLFNRKHLENTSYFAFMASAREEASNNRRQNHDIAITSDNYLSKVPVQVKRSLRKNNTKYDEQILMVGFSELQQAIYDEYNKERQNSENLSDITIKSLSIPRLLVKEHRLGHNREADPLTTRLLDAGSDALIESVYQHAVKYGNQAA